MDDDRRLAELTELAERIEAEALAAVTLAAPASAVSALGLTLLAVDGAVASFAAAADVLALNRVIGLGLSSPASEAQLDRILDFARAGGVRRLFVQLVPTAAPADLVAWLRSRGGQPYNRWVRLWRRAGDPLPPRVPGDLQVARIGPDDAHVFGRVVRTAFGMPAVVDPWMAAVVGRPGWEHYVALDQGDAVAVGAMFASAGVAWLGFAATLPSHRGRGAQSALIEQRLRRAAALGCDWVVAETAEDLPDRPAPSYRNMRRHGFADAYRRQNYLLALNPAAARQGAHAP